MMQHHMPIGYRMAEGKIQIDKEKAKIVRMVFRDYVSGISTYALAKKLTAMGALNANQKPSWNHGSIGKILENTRYLGDDFYPAMIEPELFQQVQKYRETQRSQLGRIAQPNSMQNGNVFTGKLRCGKCGEVFRKYVEHCGKPSERSNWKCKKYIVKNRIHCRCGVVTEEQLTSAFLKTANHVIANPRLLEQKPKIQPQHFSMEYRRLDQKIKALEAAKQFSASELPSLIFQRAAECYKTAEIHDDEHNTEKMKQAFYLKESLSKFEEAFFLNIIRQVTIYADHRLEFVLINGLTIEESY